MIIDIHTHVFPPDIIAGRESYIGKEPEFTELYTNFKAKMASAEDIVDVMERQNVEISIILNFNWQDISLCKKTNDYIIDSINKYKNKLIGFGMISFDNIEDSLYELERCARNGIKGIGEYRPSVSQLNNIEYIRPVIQRIIDLDLVLLMHSSEPVGHKYSGKGDITPEVVYPFIQAFPELKLICAHWGGGLPFYSLMPEVKTALKNVYFDTAASPYLYSPQIYLQMRELAGENKIIFGSDYPLMSPSKLIKQIDELGLDKDYYNSILGGNAVKLLKIQGVE